MRPETERRPAYTVAHDPCAGPAAAGFEGEQQQSAHLARRLLSSTSIETIRGVFRNVAGTFSRHRDGLLAGFNGIVKFSCCPYCSIQKLLPRTAPIHYLQATLGRKDLQGLAIVRVSLFIEDAANVIGWS